MSLFYSYIQYKLLQSPPPPNQKLHKLSTTKISYVWKDMIYCTKVEYIYHMNGQWLNKLDVKQMNWDRSWTSGLQTNQYHTKKDIL